MLNINKMSAIHRKQYVICRENKINGKADFVNF